MELIILSLGGSLGAVLSHLLEFISQRTGRAPPATVASTQTARRRPAELQTEPRVVAFSERVAEHKRVTPSERCA